MTNTLDLDALVPEDKTVKVNGKLWTVHPLKLKSFIKLQQTLQKVRNNQGSQDEMIEMMGDMFDSMRSAVPDIDEMDLNFDQAMALLMFLYKKEKGNYQPAEEKKTEVSPS